MMSTKRHISTALKSSIWIPVVVAILTLVLGITLSEIQSNIGWLPLLLALTLSLLIFVFCFHLLVNRVFPISIYLLEDLKNEIKRIVGTNTISWVLNSHQLAEHESQITAADIWVVSSDLADDIPGQVFFNVVKSNLKRGIRYKYFIPKSLSVEARAKQILENHKKAGDIQFIPLTDEFFFLVPNLDFAIYDPYNIDGDRTGFMGIPTESTLRFHAEIDSNMVDLIVGKLQQLP